MVSPRKSSSGMSLLQEERYHAPSSTKSCESLYSNSSRGSATVLYRRKTPIEVAIGNRQPTMVAGTTEVRQRVLSARRLRMKTYQNQLVDAQQTIADLAHENRILRTLHKRQDSALSKYESASADLPKLLHSHAEELRVWQTKYRNLQALNKDLEQKLKQKETTILSLSDQNKYYSQLIKDKNLEERHRLTDKLHTLEVRLQEKEHDMKMMARKVQLEGKNLKQQLQKEQARTKEVMVRLEKARLELSGYRKLDELNEPDKYSNISLRRKPNKDEADKLERFEKDEFSSPDIETTPFPGSQKSIRNKIASKLQRNIAHTFRKMKTPIMEAQPPHQLRMERDDSDVLAVVDSKKVPSLPYHAYAESRDPTSTEYEVDFEPSTEHSPIDDNPEEVDEEQEYTEDVTEEEENEDVAEEGEDGEECEDEGDEEEYEENGGPNDEAEIEFKGDEGVVINPMKASSRMKKEISNIRKQITDDYKEREAFLDTFCRQATTGVLRNESPKKRPNIMLGQNLPSSRKHKLLSALKAIDETKSQD